MDKAIENLNKTVALREFMVSKIILRDTSKASFDVLDKRLNNLSFKVLNNKMKKLYGEDWRQTYNV